MSNPDSRSLFWDEHWWKPILILAAIAAIAAAGLGIHNAQSNTRAKSEACWERGGQIYEGLCITSPVSEVQP